MPVTLERMQQFMVSRGLRVTPEILQDLIVQTGFGMVGDHVTLSSDVSEMEGVRRMEHLVELISQLNDREPEVLSRRGGSGRNISLSYIPEHVANSPSVTEDLTPVPTVSNSSLGFMGNLSNSINTLTEHLESTTSDQLEVQEPGEPIASEEENLIDSEAERLSNTETVLDKVSVCRAHSIDILYSWDRLMGHIEDGKTKSAFPRKIYSKFLKISKELEQLHNKFGVIEQRVQKRRGDNRRKKEEKLKTRLNTSNNSSWLTYPIGLEYTFHLPKLKQKEKNRGEVDYRGETLEESISYENTRKEVDKYLREEAAFLKKNIDGIHIYRDAGSVLEIGSPVHKSWKNMMWWYKKINFITKKFKLVPWKPTKGGGGGHINVSFPREDVKHRNLFVYNLTIDVANRPYINWIFNDPSDNHNANSLLNIGPEFRKIVVTDSFGTLEDILGFRYAIRVKNNKHFEFRCFEMYRNKKDLYDVIKFISKWLKHIDDISKEGKVIEKDDRVWKEEEYNRNLNLQKIGESINKRKKNENLYFDDMVPIVKPEFKKMINEFGLDYKNYSRFVKRNFEKRIKEPYGKKYLV